MRKLLLGTVALVSAILLSSCALLPFGQSGADPRTQDRMTQVFAAMESEDAAALKAMFSPRALELATDIDERLDYLLSVAPKGHIDWQWGAASTQVRHAPGKQTEFSYNYVSAVVDGTEFELFLAEFTVNEVIDPENVGLYALGITPLAANRHVGPGESFFDWADSFDVAGSGESGYPGVYVPPDSSQLSLHRLAQIVEDLNTQYVLWLTGQFSDYARADHEEEIADRVDELGVLFPRLDVVWDGQEAVPVVRESTDNGGKTTLLLSTYRVSSAGLDYWLFFADFRENAIEPTNVGVYAIGVAPRTESEDSAAEQVLFSWANSFDVDARIPAGILVAH